MIPRHRPPFGVMSLLADCARSVLRHTDVGYLERLYESSLDVRNAVWIPSARYGIAQAIQQQLPADETVVCPVFNCGAVFHAAVESARHLQFADCAPDSFLVDTAIEPAPNSAVVLSEMFGHRFSAEELHQPLANDASFRIFDMAMAIPTRSDMKRMREDDVTVLSFGLGKSLYAGWGGMALTESPDIANDLRKQRDIDLNSGGRVSHAKWNAEIVARTIAHNPLLYKSIRQRRKRNPSAEDRLTFTRHSHEWHRGTTALNATISIRNLQQSERYSALRQEANKVYRDKLGGMSEHLTLPPHSTPAPSHFTIRVPEAQRTLIRQNLWDNGVDVGTLFPFPNHLCNEDDFPRASTAAREVLNLPLSGRIRSSDVARICNVIRESIEPGAASRRQRSSIKAA